MTKARMTTLSEERDLAAFAEEVGRHFAAHPEHWTYSREDLGPGVLLGLRWGMNADCVLVVKTDAEFFPVNFQQSVRAQPSRPMFWRCAGALMCDTAIEGVTDDLEKSENDPEGCVKFYGGRYFVCESVGASAAKQIAEALGGTYVGERSA